jgi:hypothetical protein
MRHQITADPALILTEDNLIEDGGAGSGSYFGERKVREHETCCFSSLSGISLAEKQSTKVQ